LGSRQTKSVGEALSRTCEHPVIMSAAWGRGAPACTSHLDDPDQLTVMATRRLHRRLASLGLLALVAVFGLEARAGGEPEGPAFEVTYAPEVAAGPISGRVYVMLGPVGATSEPRFGPDWFDPQPFFAVEVEGWM